MKILSMMTLILSLSAVVLARPTMAVTPEQSVLNQIQQAKQQLNTTEKSVLKQRIALSKELEQLEQEVLGLRNETAVARRKMDERTLSLSQLEHRLSSWQEQQDFQRNLLDRFLQQSGMSFQQLDPLTLADKLVQARHVSSQLKSAIYPTWQPQQLVLSSGEIAQANTLKIGPITWFIDANSQQAGLASKQDNMLKTIAVFDASQYDDLALLASSQSGSVLVDPTLGRAATKQGAEESLLQHVVKGGIWVVPILFFGLIATLIGLFKLTQLWKLPGVVTTPSTAELNQWLAGAGQRYAAIKDKQLALLNIAKQAVSIKERDDALFAALQRDKHQLERWNNVIAVTAAVAPLLGLLGTVSGMIETFQMMTAFGTSDPEIISGGIAKALVTTELGLVVAIPALILNAILSRKAKHYYEQLESFALVISNDEREIAATKPLNEQHKATYPNQNNGSTMANDALPSGA